MSTNLNGYEIRLELLKMAKELLTEKYHSERSTAQMIWSTEVEGLRAESLSPSKAQLNVPNFPTTKEITGLADELNTFINKK